ncbi:MAG: response regulator [Desulfobulbaceae bacterium]|nr:response regulator [Desulfobulbaceae bacterium]
MPSKNLKKILFVEPSKVIQKKLALSVANESFEFRAVKNADQALVEIIRWHPDILISSIEVGNISGFDLCLIIRMMPDFAGMPIILFSSSDPQNTSRKAEDVGADYYVQKDEKGIASLNRIITDILHGPQASVQSSYEKRPIRTVLLVDDSVTMRKIIRNILIGIGITRVLEANDGMEGLQLIKTEAIDLVISDWSMPRMNGLEMIKKIRTNSQFDTIPIVMVTAEVEEEIEKAMHLGVDDYLRKPFNLLDMKKMIAKFTECATEQ